MPKSKPMPRNVKAQAGKLRRVSVAANPAGNRAERRAAAKKTKRTGGK